jgi:EpsI family protein
MRGSLRPILLALAFLATYGFTRAVAPVAPAAPADLAGLPMTLPPWAGVTAPPLPADVMAGLAADDYVRRYYAGAQEQWVEMDVAYYAQPRIGANMHSPLNCLPGNGWQITQADTVTLPRAADARIQALTVQRGESRYAMAYWFQSGERVLTGEVSTRFQLLADSLQRRPTDAGLVRVMAPFTTPNAQALVVDFAERLLPELSKVFRRT